VRRLKRLAVGAVVAPSAAARADPALFFLFDRTSAVPNDRVTLRTGGTPTHFTAMQRVKQLKPPIRVYLVPNELVGDVHSRFDPRLAFVGVLVPIDAAVARADRLGAAARRIRAAAALQRRGPGFVFRRYQPVVGHQTPFSVCGLLEAHRAYRRRQPDLRRERGRPLT
jgi:hypothetical protein